MTAMRIPRIAVILLYCYTATRSCLSLRHSFHRREKLENWLNDIFGGSLSIITAQFDLQSLKKFNNEIFLQFTVKTFLPKKVFAVSLQRLWDTLREKKNI